MTDQNQQPEYVLESQEQLAARGAGEGGEFESLPIESDDYIVKLAKISFLKKPTYNDPTKLEWQWEMICLPYSLKTGDKMSTVSSKTTGKKFEVQPLRSWIWRNINPYSIGFQQDKVTPSFLRGLICYMTGQDVQGNVKPDNFILLDGESVVVNDVEVRKQFLQEMYHDDKPLHAQGFKALPDIRMYEGKYIGATIEIDQKGRNKITRFSKLPSSFQPVENTEALEKFNESYQKMISKKNNAPVQAINNAQVQYSAPVKNEQVDVEDIAF